MPSSERLNYCGVSTFRQHVSESGHPKLFVATLFMDGSLYEPTTTRGSET